MAENKFFITHLYPKDMSIYGDYGNILAIQYRLKKYGLEPIYQTVEKEEKLPKNTDLYFMGGGQDEEQLVIFKDLLNKKTTLKKDIESGVSLLSICGGYQLLGHKFLTGSGQLATGLEIFPVQTTAPSQDIKARCVGNLIVKSQLKELNGIELVGFENHSGQTTFTDKKAIPLGKVLYGFGNNLNKEYEGCVYKNAIGTYLHGSLLPKNPRLADWLIFKSLEKKVKQAEFDKERYLEIKRTKIDDSLAIYTKQALLKRFLSE